MMGRWCILALAVAVALSGCGRLASLSSGASGPSGPFSGPGTGFRGAVQEIDGVRYRTRLSVDDGDRRLFSTATLGAQGAPLAATEAGRLEAVGYCLRTFGGSHIEWTIAPATQPEEVAISEDGALVLRGRCIAR
jgi:hypothetical protein